MTPEHTTEEKKRPIVRRELVDRIVIDREQKNKCGPFVN